jgi:glutathione peroxidase-family protein
MEIGEKLFNFSLPATNGSEVNNFTFADRHALLIIVSCNHCPYARAYWSRIKKLHNKYEQDNLGLLVISGNDADQYPEDSFENMKELAQQQGDWLLYLYDDNQDVIKKLGAERTPEAFLFNSKRELVYRGALDDSWENEHMVTRVYLEDAIEYTLDGLEVDFPEVPAVGCSIKWKPGNEPA